MFYAIFLGTEDLNLDSSLNVSQESLVTPDEIDADSEKVNNNFNFYLYSLNYLFL